jgi:benzoyl-CoA reductase/2-hydroxyglutaryl-CoA dehydratase subunit BcrC/BadD/HgdB
MIADLIAEAGTLPGESVKRWKEAGGRVVGYACVFTPPEILEACGLLPFRLRAAGRGQTDRADARLSRFNCSFCRACLDLGLGGDFDFFDGLVETNGCDQLRGMFENWQYAHPTAFFHYLKAPHILTPDSFAYFAYEVRRYHEAIADHFEATVDEAALWDAIDRQASIRGLLRRILEMRERERPALTGAEALALVVAGGNRPAAAYEALLREFITERADHAIDPPRARLLLGGAATDEVEFVAMIEELGGAVVSDALCFGARAFWAETPTERTDPWRHLAETYLGGALCPRMVDQFDRRLDFFTAAVARARVDGIVLVHNKFCDIHGIDNALLRLRLQEQGVPVLTLEKEYGAAADRGRMQTRVQAFLERLGGA